MNHVFQFRFLTILVLFGFLIHPLRSEVPGSLEFEGGFKSPGILLDSTEPDTIVFDIKGFEKPLEFPMGNSILFRPNRIHSNNLPYAASKRIMLRNSDYLDGNLVDISDKFVTWKSDIAGLLEIPREKVAQIFFPKAQSSLFFGPRDISDWQVISGNGQNWNYSGGSLSTSSPNSVIYKNFPSLAQVQIHLKLSWKSSGDFLIAIGTSDLDEDIASAYRLETWSGELVAQRETTDDIDLFSISSLNQGASEIDLKLSLNQVTGELVTYDAKGKKLGSLKVPPDSDMLNHGILIKNKGGDLSVDQLNIIPLNLDLSPEDKFTSGFIVDTKGELIPLDEVNWDRDTQSFQNKPDPEGDQGASPEENSEKPELESQIAGYKVDSLQLIHFNAFYEKVEPSDAVDCNGVARISGDASLFADDAFHIEPEWFNDELKIPVDELGKVSFRDTSKLNGDNTKPKDSTSDIWMLEMNDTSLAGTITGVTSYGPEEIPAINWLSASSRFPVAIQPGVTGFLYPRKEKIGTSLRNNAITKNLLQLNNKIYSNLILLKTGEIVPCKILRSEGEQVEILTFFNKKAQVPLGLIRSLEFTNKPVPDYFTKSSKKIIDPSHRRMPIQNFKNAISFKQKENLDNFLTLPRPRKYLPPTHLIRAINGDIIKADFISLDDTHIVIELNELKRKIPRDRIASISPVSPPLSSQSDSDDSGAVGDNDLVPEEESLADIPIAPGTVQLQLDDDYYLNILPDGFENHHLNGQSDIFGDCIIPSLMVKTIALKPNTKPAKTKWPYLDWRLVHAIEPIAATAKANNQGAMPRDPMAGKPAPDFVLSGVDSSTISLAKLKGKIVVLDFWASWCGPCMISMPDIIRTTSQFDPDEVVLIGVNIKEDTRTVRRTLNSRGFELYVAMDSTGTVAEKYSAQNIPRTVVIDKDGIVQWAHTGASPQLASNLEKVITAIQKGIPVEQAFMTGVGEKAPDFSTRLTNGTPFGLANLNGKVTVLDFWATWCGPCIQAMPDLIAAVNEFESDSVQLVGVNQGQDAQTISDFMLRKNWEFDVALDSNMSIGKKYGVEGIPHTVVIDPDGNVAHIQIGFQPGTKESLIRIIRNLLPR